LSDANADRAARNNSANSIVSSWEKTATGFALHGIRLEKMGGTWIMTIGDGQTFDLGATTSRANEATQKAAEHRN
jgi:hypothetical protein